MNGAGIAVVIAAAAALAGLGWFFFAPRRAHAAELAGGVQRVTVTVKGGYAPDVIRAQPGIPLELVFDRQESGDCTSRVVFPDLAMSAALPAYEQTTVRVAAPAAGSFGFACGMNMIHGTLIVDPGWPVTPPRCPPRGTPRSWPRSTASPPGCWPSPTRSRTIRPPPSPRCTAWASRWSC